MALSDKQKEEIARLLTTGKSNREIARLVECGEKAIRRFKQRRNEANNVKATVKNGSIYIIKAGDKNIYKIGVATDIGNRLNTLQTANYEELKVVRSFYLENVYEIEKELHFIYREKNIRGEWFRLSDNDILEIEGYIYNGYR